MAATAGIYVDFVPQHSLVEEPDKKIFVVDLSTAGFKKEQLRVQIDNLGRMRISGERPLDGNRWSRFRKDLRVPEDCNAGAVRPKFEKDGLLRITMPRLSPAEEAKATGDDANRDQKAAEEEKKRAATAAQADQEEKKRAAAAEAEEEKKRQEDDTKRLDQEGGCDGGAAREAVAAPATRPACGMMVWTLLLCVVLALFGAGLYAQYRLMDSSAGPAPADDHIAALSEY